MEVRYWQHAAETRIRSTDEKEEIGLLHIFHRWEQESKGSRLRHYYL